MIIIVITISTTIGCIMILLFIRISIVNRNIAEILRSNAQNPQTHCYIVAIPARYRRHS